MSQASLWSQQAAPALPTPEYAEAGEAEGIPEPRPTSTCTISTASSSSGK